MDQIALVENQIHDGQRLLDQLRADGIVVRAACWVKPAEDDWWSLYIASPARDEIGPSAGYGRIIPVLHSLGDVMIGTSDIKLVGENHPIVQDAAELLRRFPHSAPIQPPNSLFGGITVDEVYVYPLGKTEVTIHGMVFRGEPNGVVHLSFERHNPQSWLTIDGTQYFAETGIDWVVAAPDRVTLEPNESGPKVLAWDFHGNRIRSNANEIWTLAKLGLHGFRFLREPSLAAEATP